MKNILFENSKQEYQMSVTVLLRLKEKRSVQGVFYFTNKIPKFIKKKVSIQNIQSIYLELKDILKIAWFPLW
jgi:hypothetical protein